ncbi:MAG: TniQ family protein [Xenococcaceae cyanobacterium]
MSNHDDIYHELWNPKPLKIRQPSHLFSLEPIGIGTAITESLSSYLSRLAQEHCVSLQKFIMGEISSLILSQEYELNSIGKNISIIFGNSDAKPAINGMRELTGSLTQALEQLTLRQDLHFLSFFTWKGIIRERGLFRQHKAWCPQCFKARRQEKKPIYEPLLWSFRSVDFCLQHNSKLIEKCPHCDSQQKAIANFSIPGYCYKCRHWLGEYEKTGSLSQDNFRESYVIAKNIGDLIAFTPQLNYQPNLRDLKKKFKLILFCFERSIHKDLSQYIVSIEIIEKLKVDLKQNYLKPMNLTELVIPVCQKAKISISQLFANNYDSLAAILSQNIEIDYKIS